MTLYRNKQKFIGDARGRMPDFDEELISRAWDVARETYTSLEQKQVVQKIDSSRPFGVAHNLLSIECDSKTIAAALLYDLVGSKLLTIKETKKRFGTEVAALVEGVIRLTPLDMLSERTWMHGDLRRESRESIHKFFVAIVDDPRVSLIKLADRLYTLTTFGALTEERKRKFAQESLDVFAPLAEALELGAFQSRIQELAFRYLDPDTYRNLEQKLRVKWEECKRIRDIAVRSLEDDLAKAGINANVYDRKKEIYSIHQKMQSYKLKFEEVYDIVGIRIIVDTEEDCYRALQIVHQLGTEVKYDDWIHAPRGQGGYQSLHKVVRGTEGVLLEIQIRSKEMHVQAERGSAAHWIYKLGGTSPEPEFVKKLHALRETLENSVVGNGSKEYEYTYTIHVLTPEGDVVLLPAGSTPLDFAYRIHTIIGHECRGAWVMHRTWNSRKYVPLDYELDDGDIVEIDRRKGATPHLSWITEGKARSHLAQQKIRRYFLAQERAEMLAVARNQVQEQLRQISHLQVGMHDILNALVQTKLLNEQTDEEGLYLAIASGSISIDRLQTTIGEIVVKRFLVEGGLSKESVWNLVKWFGELGKLSILREDALFLAVTKQDISIKQLEQAIRELTASNSTLSSMASTMQTAPEDHSADRILSFHAAQCCYPLPDEDIVGFVTVGHGLSVHRQSCPQVATLCSRDKLLVPITWKDLAIPKKHDFNSRLIVTLRWYDSKLYVKIQEILLKTDAIIREVSGIGSSQIRFIIGVKNVEHIQEIQSRIRQIEGVSDACRQEPARKTAHTTGVGRRTN
jgi:GTP diphosphokinase / guanosine-3',5'-bis(diphosphate) 3'-diphosphatase